MYNKNTCPQIFKLANVYSVLSTMSHRSIYCTIYICLSTPRYITNKSLENIERFEILECYKKNLTWILK